MNKGSNKLTKKQESELKSIEDLSDLLIDVGDAPEILDWSNAKRGVFYRLAKR